MTVKLHYIIKRKRLKCFRDYVFSHTDEKSLMKTHGLNPTVLQVWELFGSEEKAKVKSNPSIG